MSAHEKGLDVVGERAAGNRGMRPLILVVDDEEEQRHYFKRALTSGGYRVIVSANGADALMSAVAERPALVIVDVNMGGMDGVDCCRFFRSTPATRAIPLLLTTALPLPPGVLGAVSSGLDGVPVLLKQEGLGKLLSLVSSITKERMPPRIGNTPHNTADARRYYRGGREIVVNSVARWVSIDGRKLPRLAARRFDLLVTLLGAEEALSRDQLLERIWNGIDNPNLVDVTVLRLRQDLKKVPAFRIKAERDGYLLVFRDSSASYRL